MNRKMKKVLVPGRLYMLFFRALLGMFVLAVVVDHMFHELTGLTPQPSMLEMAMAIFAFLAVLGVLHLFLCLVATSTKRQRNYFTLSRSSEPY